MRDRKVERILIKKEVTINDNLKAQTFDISEGGMYIHTEADFTPGSVIEASNYLEALKLLQDSTPDIVVLDIWQEGMDGFRILQRSIT